MNSHLKRLLQTVQDSCDTYIERKASLLRLQQSIDAVGSSLDNSVDKTIGVSIENFVERLEYIRFMYEEAEQYPVVVKEIEKLKKVLGDHQ